MQQMSGKLGGEGWILSNIRCPRARMVGQHLAIAEPRCWGE